MKTNTMKTDTMKTKKSIFARFWGDVRGISSVEYALLLAFVGIGVVGAAGALSNAVQNEMQGTASCISTGIAANC